MPTAVPPRGAAGLSTLLFAWGIAHAPLACAQQEAPSAGQARQQEEVIWEWSAYYSSVGLLLPLEEYGLPDGGEMSEWEVYRRLFGQSLKPRTLLLEASVYPAPAFGTWVRRRHPGFYDHATLGEANDFNLVKTLTAGFQEPWAISMFLGNQMPFSRPGEERRDTNRGYMGFLFSYGSRHIKDNVLIDDDWMEFEWKMKGERKFKTDQLSWNFKVGAKVNRNAEVTDLFYVGAARSNLDFHAPLLSWLSNSKVDLKTEFTRHGRAFARQEVVFGKKYPLAAHGVALALDFGLIYERDVKYSGSLAGRLGHVTTLVVRPNIEF